MSVCTSITFELGFSVTSFKSCTFSAACGACCYERISWSCRN